MPGTFIEPQDLARRLFSCNPPLLFDVRREKAFQTSAHVLPAARRAIHTDWLAEAALPAGRPVVVYCVHGHNVSQLAMATLRAHGVEAYALQGGIEGWRDAGLPLVARAPDAAMRFGSGSIWVTRQKPKIDRIACPWFIRRFVDDRARFLFVEPDQVLAVADELGAIAFDIADAPVTHIGGRCSFDALLDRYAIEDPVLRQLADIVCGADTGAPDMHPASAGLLAVSLGLAAIEPDDQALIERAFSIYDGLHASLRYASHEVHLWQQTA